LKQEFARSPSKRTTVQNLKRAIEQRLKRLLEQNPMRTDFQQHYEEIVAEYNREKDRVTIESFFNELLNYMETLNEEESRNIREGLDKESLAIFDILKKNRLTPVEIKQVKKVAVDLLATLKARKLKVNNWRDKESTRDAVRVVIRDFLWRDDTGLPAVYAEDEIEIKAEDVFRHVHWAYPTVPSPYYAVV